MVEGRPDWHWSGKWRSNGMHLISGTTSVPAAKSQTRHSKTSLSSGHERHRCTCRDNRVARTPNTTGTVAARDLIAVLPQTTGLQIKQILVEAGDVVKTGQVMAVLDNSV